MTKKPRRTPGILRRQRLFDEWLSDPTYNGQQVTFTAFQEYCDAGMVRGLEPEGFQKTQEAPGPS